MKNRFSKRSFCCLCIALVVGFTALLPNGANAEVQLPAVFSDHMVLQRDLDVPIWGTSDAGAKVVVKFRDQTKETTADEQGRWLLRLESLGLGTPANLTVSSGNTITLEDVLVGDVWIGSGQSNMAGGVGGYARNDEVLAKLADTDYPQMRLCRGSGGGWRVADKAANASFSALLFSFGQSLHQELDVPVGLILGAVGGTPSGRWLTQEMLDADKPSQAALKKAAEVYSPEAHQAAYDKALSGWERAAAAAKKAGKRSPRKPSPPVGVGQARSGKTGDLYAAHIQPVVPFGICGVLWDQGESGTAIEGLDQFHTMGALINGWRTAWGQSDFPFLYVQKPSGGGCAWDPSDPMTRKADAFAQLPSTVPDGRDGLYRELHISIMKHPFTAMVTARDLGSGVHPTNKSGYGQRAADVALGFVYQQAVAVYGPLYQSHKIEGDKVHVEFTHVGKGLATKYGERLQGFAIAGEDREFHWADAEINGNSIIVSSDKVAKPMAVRYAWARSSPWANLFNKDGMPALTFRTDKW